MVIIVTFSKLFIETFLINKCDRTLKEGRMSVEKQGSGGLSKIQ